MGMERATLTGGISQRSKKGRGFAGPLVWLWLLTFCTGTGVAAVLWLTTLPPLPDCEQFNTLSLEADRLFCVEQAARSGREDSLVAGLDLVKDWSVDHPLYNRAQTLMGKWSESVLELARLKAIEADLTGAIALAQKIPPNSPVYQDASATIAAWQQDLKQGQAIVDAVQAAMKARNWKVATEQIRVLSQMGSDYWRQQVTRLRQQISTEEIAASQLQNARNLVQATPDDIQVLGRAIALAEQINPETYAYTAAKSEIDRWMANLYQAVAGQLTPTTSLEGAKATVQRLPRGVPIPDVKDILWFSRAQPLVTETVPRGPLVQQLWHLWLTYSQVNQIRPNSPLYNQSQTMLPRLQQQIQDVTQLTVADTLASAWQIPTFQLAIQVAQGIRPDRPRRIHAQTLISMWQKDIERVQDRPHLLQAQQLATAGSPEALRQAIAAARQIPTGRPLYAEAQKEITQWNRQIQLIEDEPILKQARTLAKQQRLDDAMQVASRIRPGRVLYQEAQTAITTWRIEIETAADQPLLDRAYNLAAEGQLTAAINLASQIRPGRSLYRQAQSAIATWNAQQSKARQSQPDTPAPSQTPSSINPDPLLSTPPSQFPTLSSETAPPRLSPQIPPSIAPLPQSSPPTVAPTVPGMGQTPPLQSPLPGDYPVETQEVLPEP